MKCIILDVFKGVRKLNRDKSYPISLEQLSEGKLVLDWHLKNLELKNVDFYYIGSYHIEKIINKYNNISVFYDENGLKNLELIHKILLQESDDILIIQSNILYKNEFIKNILDSKEFFNITISRKEVDNQLPQLFGDETIQYYSGITFIRNEYIIKVLEDIELYLSNHNEKNFLSWIEYAANSYKFDINKIDSVEVVDIIDVKKRDLRSKFLLGTKAQTLENMSKMINKAVILEQISFTVEEWANNSDIILNEITTKFKGKNLVVRSSSLSEDSFNESNAGRFESYLNIDSNNKILLKDRIDRVIKSYNSTNLKNQVLVQEYIHNSLMSGVVFTRNLEDSSPYYIVNYDDESGCTDTVTSGKSKNIKCEIILKNAKSIKDGSFKMLIEAVGEIQDFIGYEGLDIEFIIDKNNLYIVQVRPITLYDENMILTDEDIFNEVEELKKYLNIYFKRDVNLFGDTTILGNMPDWNPAELIGANPRPLSLSLYQYLITNGAWAVARSQIGYKDLGYEPLVISLSGKPYVDVRKSLNSFLPPNLSKDISEKLINYQLKKLRNNNELHDKIEFTIAKSVMDFDFDTYRDELLRNGFDIDEISIFEEELIKLTNNIFDYSYESIQKEREKLNILAYKRKNHIKEYDVEKIPSIINTLINECIIYGIIPFSVLARYAFIAMSFLKTMKEKNIVNSYEYHNIMSSIPTVASEFTNDTDLLNSSELSREEFLEKYGHLRPNTYDINSLNYKEGFDCYFIERNYIRHNKIDSKNWLDIIFEEKSKLINEQLNKSNINIDYLELKNFIYNSIVAREWSKFEFTKNINLILELISIYGENNGISREDMSYLTIDKILSLSFETPSYLVHEELKRYIEYKKKKYSLTQSIKLPNLVLEPDDVEQFSINENTPNFITNKTITKEIIQIDVSKENLDNKIVLIENADPGYDWIFSHRISGLITKYGGAASHMSIRCAEFGIPAAIGSGDVIYERLKKATVIELNCENGQIKVIK